MITLAQLLTLSGILFALAVAGVFINRKNVILLLMCVELLLLAANFNFIAFAFLRSWMTGSPWQAEIAPITGPMYQLFIFFMITDPKTTVRSKTGQCVVVFLVALMEMVMRLNQIVYAPFYALFIVGPSAMLIEMWMDSRRANSEKLAVAR